jgi:hypothetical protein
VEASDHGILSLLHSLNDSLKNDKITDDQLEQSYSKFYKDLEHDLEKVRVDVAVQRESRFRIFSSQLDRTKAIAKDLETLKRVTPHGMEPICIRYSGFLSPFAISDHEITFNAKRAEYNVELKRERNGMIELANDDRFVLRCIVTPPTKFHVPSLMLEYTEMRLERLREFLLTDGKCLNIDWAISPFQQKNTYIIGGISCFEGFKQGAEEGYRFTLRYAGPEEVDINIKMFDELYRKLVASTLTHYPSDMQLEDRDALREATLKCVSEAIEEIRKHRLHQEASAPSVPPERTQNSNKRPRKRRR